MGSRGIRVFMAAGAPVSILLATEYLGAMASETQSCVSTSRSPLATLTLLSRAGLPDNPESTYMEKSARRSPSHAAGRPRWLRSVHEMQGIHLIFLTASRSKHQQPRMSPAQPRLLASSSSLRA